MHGIVTFVAVYLVVIPVVAYLYLAYTQRHNLKQLLVFTAISLVVTYLLTKLAGAIHSDPRPFIRDGVTPYFHASHDNGFPSDHTTYSALIAFIVLRYKRNLGIALAVLAVLIGSARVIGGVHHAQDIVAGLVIAALGVYLAKIASDWLLHTFDKSKKTSPPEEHS